MISYGPLDVRGKFSAGKQGIYCIRNLQKILVVNNIRNLQDVEKTGNWSNKKF
jgi:hypothetical protein